MSSACQSANMAHMRAAPSEKASRLPKPPSTLIIPYGLKSMLKAISHAVLVEDPPDITEYMASYCKEILSLREEHPQLSIKELTTLLKFMKGHSVTSCTSLVPCLSDMVQDEIPHANAAMVKSSSKMPSESLQHLERTSYHDEDLDEEDLISPRTILTVSADPVSHSDNAENALIHSVSGAAIQSDSGEGIHVPCLEMEEEEDSLPSVQSALFVRASPEKCTSNESLVLIEALRPPSQSMIIVHSDNLPNVIVFQNSEQQSSPKEVLEQKPDVSGSHVNACPDVVVFHKVPSVQDVAQSLNLLEEQEELDYLRYTVEVLEPAQRAGAADILPSDPPAPAPEGAVNEMKPSRDGLSENRTYGNARDEATILSPSTETAEVENSFSAVSSNDTEDECVTELSAAQRGSVTISVRETAVEKGSPEETSCPEITEKTTPSAELINVELNSQKSVCPEVVEIHKVPSVQDVAHSNDIASVTDDTSPKQVVELERTQQETSSSHDTSEILYTKEPLKTIQFMEPLAKTGLPLFKRKVDQTSAISIKMAIIERDKLIKKILQSAQMKKQTDISKSRVTGITVSSNIGGWPAQHKKTSEANTEQNSAVEEQLEGTTVQTVPTGPGSQVIDMAPALHSSVDQVWTLYQMAEETKAKPTSRNPSPSQSDSSASPEKIDQTTMSGDYSHPSKSEPSEKESGQSPKSSPLSNTQLVNTPNYVLVNDEDTGRKGNQPGDTAPNTDKKRPRSSASRKWIKQFLSISLPVDPLCNDPAGNQPLFYGLTSDQGNMACSPVFVREINPAYAASNEDNGRERESTPSSSIYMQWSIEITLKKSTGEQPPRGSSLKK